MKLRKTLALVTSGGLLLLPPLAYAPAGEQAPAETRVSVDHSPLRLHTLPFSVEQVLDYFNEAFGKRPFKIDHKRFVYTDRENPDEVVIMTVSDFETSLGVVLLATGDYGVNYIREFFEAPFFLRPESEHLYMLLDRGPGIRSVALERFNVQMRISEAGRWLLVALEFSPSELYRPQLTLVTSRRVGSIDECQFFGRGKAITGKHECVSFREYVTPGSSVRYSLVTSIPPSNPEADLDLFAAGLPLEQGKCRLSAHCGRGLSQVGVIAESVLNRTLTTQA